MHCYRCREIERERCSDWCSGRGTRRETLGERCRKRGARCEMQKEKYRKRCRVAEVQEEVHEERSRKRGAGCGCRQDEREGGSWKSCDPSTPR